MKVLINLARKPVIGLFTAIVAFSLATSLQAQTTAAKTKVQSVKGTAFYTPPGGSKTALKTGAMLAPGTKIETGARSTVDIYFGPMAGMVRIAEKSTLVVEQFNTTKTSVDQVVDLQLNLPEGTIYGTVNKLSAASKYHVKTPDGVAGIRGTKYQITVRRNAAGVMTGYVLVTEGSIVVVKIKADGQTSDPAIVDGGYRLDDNNTITPLTQPEIDEINEVIRIAIERGETEAPPAQIPGEGTRDGQPEIPITR